MPNDYFNPPNSIWPNGLKKDDEGYIIFYPLGTNKIDISTITWPEGDTLISPFVYQNDKLVGFVDTKALTVSGNTTTTMDYSHIEADFSSISEGKLTVNAPNAIVKKFIWSVADSGDNNVIVTFKYKGCKAVDDVKAVDPDYLTNDIVDGVWSEGLGDLESACTSNYIGLFEECESLISFNSDLSSLTSGDYMFYWCEYLKSFTADLSNMTSGESMFDGCENLESFSSDSSGTPVNLSSLTNGSNMFVRCKNLESFSSDLSSLINGESMFSWCEKLTSFSSDLPSLTNGHDMFSGCPFTSFSSDLSSLTDGGVMFDSCENLTLFSSDLPSLTNGGSMFLNCRNLASFSSDLSSLTDGGSMFSSCTNLTSFSSDLSSLTEGTDMFVYCKLDAASVKNIIDTINNKTSSRKLRLGIGCNDTTEDKDLFAREVGYTDMRSLLNALYDKGWTTASVQYNGRPTSTYSLRKPSESTLPVFVKLEETENHADYASEDDSKKYRLNWFHETTGSTDGYIQFNSLEEAIQHFNIKPIEK